MFFSCFSELVLEVIKGTETVVAYFAAAKDVHEKVSANHVLTT